MLSSLFDPAIIQSTSWKFTVFLPFGKVSTLFTYSEISQELLHWNNYNYTFEKHYKKKMWSSILKSISFLLCTSSWLKEPRGITAVLTTLPKLPISKGLYGQPKGLLKEFSSRADNAATIPLTSLVLAPSSRFLCQLTLTQLEIGWWFLPANSAH